MLIIYDFLVVDLTKNLMPFFLKIDKIFLFVFIYETIPFSVYVEEHGLLTTHNIK